MEVTEWSRRYKTLWVLDEGIANPREQVAAEEERWGSTLHLNIGLVVGDSTLLEGQRLWQLFYAFTKN